MVVGPLPSRWRSTTRAVTMTATSSSPMAAVWRSSFPSGQYLARMPNGGGTCGVAVSPSGDVYVAGANQNGGTVTKFIPGLHDRPDEWQPRSELRDLDPNSCNIAVDSAGAVYVDTETGFPTINLGSPLKKYKSSLFNIDNPIGKMVDPNSTTFAIDPSNDDVYVDEGTDVARFDSTGNELESFGAGDLGLSSGIGFNPTSGTAYVSDLFSGVYIYTAQDTPDITGVSATAGQTTAAVRLTLTSAARDRSPDARSNTESTPPTGRALPVPRGCLRTTPGRPTSVRISPG